MECIIFYAVRKCKTGRLCGWYISDAFWPISTALPSDESPIPCCTTPAITSRRRRRSPSCCATPDKTILRKLAEQVAAVAAKPIHRQKAELWRRLNDRDSVRPMVWINEIPWHEMDVDGELATATLAPLGPVPGTRAAAAALPVAAHAGRHDRQRLPRLPAGHPQHRLRDHRAGRHRPHRRGQRYRLAALPQADPRFRRPGEDPHAGGHPQRAGHRAQLSRRCASCTAISCRSRKSARRTSGSPPGIT